MKVLFGVIVLLLIFQPMLQGDVKGTTVLELSYDTFTTSNTSQTSAFEETTFSFGWDSGKKRAGPSVKLRPDVYYSQVLVGRQDSTANWGIYCSTAQNTSSQCLYTPGQVNGMYRNASYTAEASSTDAFPTFGSINAGSSQMPIVLVNNPVKDNWPMGDTGVIGLAPNSPFFNYTMNQYNFADNQFAGRNSFVFSFIYSLYKDDGDKFQGQNADTWSYSQLTLNGYDTSRLDTSKPTAVISQGTNSPYWYINNVQISAGGQNVLGPVKACIMNTENFFFGVSNSGGFSNNVFQGLCSSTSTCNYNDMLSSSKKLIISFNDDASKPFQIQLNPQDYSFPNSGGKMILSVQDLSNFPALAGKCQGSDIVLGRLFFNRNMIYFRVNLDGSAIMYVSQLLPFDRITNTERWVLFAFGLVLILGIIGTVIYKCTRPSEDASRFSRGETYKRMTNA